MNFESRNSRNIISDLFGFKDSLQNFYIEERNQ